MSIQVDERMPLRTAFEWLDKTAPESDDRASAEATVSAAFYRETGFTLGQLMQMVTPQTA